MAPRTPPRQVKAAGEVKKGTKNSPKSTSKGRGALQKARAIQRNHAERGTGLKFNASSYDRISRFTAKTRIKYVENPKTPGSKSFDRYKLYQNAKTVGEALKHCKPADLLWEYERGYLKVLGGPMADKPACLSPQSDDPAIKILSKFRGPNGASIKIDPELRKKLESLAKQYHMDLDKIHEDAGKQCNSESADIQTARIIANEMARRKLESGKPLGDKDVEDVLSVWGFAENASRLNVLPEGMKTVHSDTLGVLRMRNGTYRIFDPTTRYENVTKLICKWFLSSKGSDIPDDFGFTGININHNYAGRRHRDNGNEGPSAIKAIGKFSGGMLDYFPKDTKKSGRCEVTALEAKDAISLDLSKKFVLFNGNNAHGVQKFGGNRFSLVFFSTSKFYKVKEKEMKTLKSLGFKTPTVATMDKVKKISLKMDKSRASRTTSKPRAAAKFSRLGA
jgi:predicted transcriptional regulator